MRVRDLFDEVLAEKVRMIFLLTTRAGPFVDLCIVLALNWLVEQYEPCLLDWDLLAMKGSSPALARIITDPH